jgi:hypothetical protein
MINIGLFGMHSAQYRGICVQWKVRLPKELLSVRLGALGVYVVFKYLFENLLYKWVYRAGRVTPPPAPHLPQPISQLIRGYFI